VRLQVLKGNVDDPGSGEEQALEKKVRLRQKAKPYYLVAVERR